MHLYLKPVINNEFKAQNLNSDEGRLSAIKICLSLLIPRPLQSEALLIALQRVSKFLGQSWHVLQKSIPIIRKKEIGVFGREFT